MKLSLFLLIAVLCLSAGVTARRKVPARGRSNNVSAPPPPPSGFVPVTLSPAPTQSFGPLPRINLPSLKVTDTPDSTNSFPSPIPSSINLPPIPPLKVPSALPPLQQFFDDDAVDDDDEI